MTMKYRILLCSLFCLCAVTVLRAERVDMLKAGAKVDGKTLNTKLINSTIDRLNANGGGTLFFSCRYLSDGKHPDEEPHHFGVGGGSYFAVF